jgi:hypothetical protein
MNIAAELCQELDDILKGVELTDKQRADVEGVKKAMSALAFRRGKGFQILGKHLGPAMAKDKLAREACRPTAIRPPLKWDPLKRGGY